MLNETSLLVLNGYVVYHLQDAQQQLTFSTALSATGLMVMLNILLLKRVRVHDPRV